MVPLVSQIPLQKVTPEAGVYVQTLLAGSRRNYTCGRKLWLESKDNTVLRLVFKKKKKIQNKTNPNKSQPTKKPTTNRKPLISILLLHKQLHFAKDSQGCPPV